MATEFGQHELSRRELIIQTARLSFKCSLIAFLVEAGAFHLADSPTTRFFLQPEYHSSKLPTTITLSPDEAKKVQEVAVGTSYVSGQNGEAPVIIATRSVNRANAGDWQSPIISAKPGSLLTDIPTQIAQIMPDVHPTNTGIITTDSGYNTLSSSLLSSPDTLSDLSYLIDALNHFDIRKSPEILRKLDNLCNAFFQALGETNAQLTLAIEEILQQLSAKKLQVYKYPPLERVSKIVHVPKDKHDSDDKNYSFTISGNNAAQVFAGRISVLGSSSVEQLLEQLMHEYTNTQIVPIDLRNILRRVDFIGKTISDEHPNLEGYRRIASQQLNQIDQDGVTFLNRVHRRVS